MKMYPVPDIGEVDHGRVIDIQWIPQEPLTVTGFVLYAARPWSADEQAVKLVLADLESEVRGLRLANSCAPVPAGLWEKAWSLASELGRRTWDEYTDCTVLDWRHGTRSWLGSSGPLPLRAIHPVGIHPVGIQGFNVRPGTSVDIKLRNDGPPIDLRAAWTARPWSG
jgi:hypothetical protein